MSVATAATEWQGKLSCRVYARGISFSFSLFRPIARSCYG